MPGDSPRFDLYCGRREFSLSAKRRGNPRMKEYQSLSHTRWDCKYHVVFIPKRRKKCIFGGLRRHLGEIFHELAGHKESKVVEGHLMSDHVHMCLSIPPKHAVANVVG
jgi:putative transposase